MIKSLLPQQSDIKIKTKRFYLRPLQLSDATTDYLGWFGDAASKKYIVSSTQMSDLKKLQAYVQEKIAKSDVLFLGIFSSDKNEHIGNIKFEPVDEKKGYACFGILIAPEWRGQGVSAEVVSASSFWLRDTLGLKRIVLGVEPDHATAIRAYEKMGFKFTKVDYFAPHNPVDLTMVWELPL